MSSVPNENHGLSGYTNWRCRCEVCRTAMRDYMRSYKRSRTGEEPMPHGLSRYTNVRCRCDVCGNANREYMRKYREDKRVSR